MRLLITAFVVIVLVLSYVAFGGIVIDFITMLRARKYIRLRGNYDFNYVRQFFVFGMVLFGISWLCLGIYLFSGIYSILNPLSPAEQLEEIYSGAKGNVRELARAVFVHILCIVSGFITINGYKKAKNSRAVFELPEGNNAEKSVICGDCGKINKSVNKFCVNCGKDLRQYEKK